MSYAAPWFAPPYPNELRRSWISYAAPKWAMPHTNELRRIVMSYGAPYWATPHPIDVRRSLKQIPEKNLVFSINLVLYGQL
jgi:hypothetical protein